MRFLVFFLIFLTSCISPSKKTESSIKPTVILISLDGFRWDYLNKTPTTHLAFLKKNGASVNKLIPVFPSSTFPNHYSIITGLYPEHHGMVANEMWDPKTEKHFKMEKASEDEWWEGEPFWITLEKQGQISAPLFWVGASAKIQGMRPHYWEPYRKISGSESVQKIFHWLDLPSSERPTFLTLYLEGVDTAGHHYGPESSQVAQAILHADKTIGELISGLKNRNLFDKTNLIVVSDHGMASVSSDHLILLDDAINPHDPQIVGGGAVVGIYKEETVLKKKFMGRNPHLHVYTKNETPKEFHYKNHRRIPPLLLLAEEGWYIRRESKNREVPRGAHGYDNRLDSMKGIFIAHGPAFRHTQLDSVENIHIYELLCHLLGVTPSANDGMFSELKPLLK